MFLMIKKRQLSKALVIKVDLEGIINKNKQADISS